MIPPITPDPSITNNGSSLNFLSIKSDDVNKPTEMQSM